ncbi:MULTISPECIES: PHP domain-containing protein [Methylomicrobium]|uniref:Putative metal-dependent phosphoesterase, PHP family n=1 Tax=Methylomicrobium album BG8 TaxID=686340 RepID=H8GP83_METAL|nr:MULTISPECIES: PHP domain-containing protein [Methylomicrobium]EIC29669.1 putative metal-dependent phosphoesterase, PHP family [Methylomicrobium album BG8]
MSEIYDLHCHSTASDGALSPAELVRRAHRQGVTALALTDHDTTAGLGEAQRTAQAEGLRFIPGIELSCQWQGKCLHIVGLGIDPAYAPLAEATHDLRNVRLHRAEQMAQKLEKKRIHGALEAVKRMAGDSMITRTHFADFLLSQGHVTSQQEAFDRYLAKGKAAYVATPWAEMGVAIDWIVKSGGVAVLAHPLRYQLTANWLRRLLNAFKEAGGQAVEVVTGRYNPEEIRNMADHASRFGLAGSAGSDFHSPDNQYVELGRLAPLPPAIRPVWDLL